MGMFLTRLDRVVLLFKYGPSTSRTLLFSNSNKGFLPHHTPRRRLVNVVLFLRGIPPRPLTMPLGWKALVLGLLATFFLLFVVSLFCLDLGLTKRSSITLSGCSPCVKTGKGC